LGEETLRVKDAMYSTSRLAPASPASAQTESSPPQSLRSRVRFAGLIAFFALLTFVIVSQLVRYQLFPPDLPDAGPMTEQEPGPRGMILDRNGTPLVVNRYYFRLTATPKHIETPEQRDEVARQLQAAIGLPYEQTMEVLTQAAEQYYAVLADAVSLEDAARLEELKAQLTASAGIFPLQHVQAVPVTKRYYAQGELTSHLLGFVRMDLGGVTGVEEYYNEFLLEDGPGLLSNQVVALNSLPAGVRRFLPSTVGKDLVLTVDRTVQWIIREELQRGLTQYQAVAGTIIVMEPYTGAILGLVNLPDYDPNRYEEADYSLYPNPAISAQYEPGSVFKIITMAAALDSGTMTPTTIYTDTGSITVGGRVIFNSNRIANGRVTATDALARSLNVVTAQIAQQMGAETFYRYVRLFGFAEATNVDLSGEIEGLIKTPMSDQWSPADLGTNSFGQGLAATPLQMLNATAAIANGGKLMRPYVVQDRVAGGQVLSTEPVIVRQALRPESAAAMAEMMTAVVESPGSTARVKGYRVAGKSGTAQIPSPEGYILDETIVSYVGFAPTDHPRFVVLVKLDRPDPSINQWAGQTAAPVFSRVAKRLLDHFGVPPEADQVASLSGPGE
jgi:cell division protein FtsI/penicillin-binding protein 2